MTHYLNGFTPDVECKTCNGNGWRPMTQDTMAEQHRAHAAQKQELRR